MRIATNSVHKLQKLLILFAFFSYNSSYSQNLPSDLTQVPPPIGNIVSLPQLYPANPSLNYVRSWTAVTALQNTTSFVNQPYTDVIQNTQYLDGLGRPIQSVTKQGSSATIPTDIVDAFTYDQYGREVNKYMSYISQSQTGDFKMDPFNDQKNFLQNQFPGEQVFYSQTDLENSPLSREIKQYAPGNSWAGSANQFNTNLQRGLSQKYLANTTDDDVKIWDASPYYLHVNNVDNGNGFQSVTYSWSQNPIYSAVLLCYRAIGSNNWINYTAMGPSTNSLTVTLPSGALEYALQAYWPGFPNGYSYIFPDSFEQAGIVADLTGAYPAGRLFKNIKSDENGLQSIKFTDKEGKLILTRVQLDNTIGVGHTGWLNTYYVYNDYDQLIFVLPPKAVQAFLEGSSINSISNELCYAFVYDNNNRIIQKKVPGKGIDEVVYDKRDRPVFTQDGNLKSRKQWLATLYDELDRPLVVGMISYDGTRPALQAYVDVNTVSNTSSPITVSTTPPSSLAPDLKINSLQSNIRHYSASNSITLEEGFNSDNSTDFAGEITSATTGQTTTNIIDVFNNALPPGSNLIPLVLTFYDDYLWTNKIYDNSNNSLLDAGNNLHAENLPFSADLMQRGGVTGMRVRILDNEFNLASGNWLETVNFYDTRGRNIQTQSENINGGIDIITTRYNFSGKPLCTYSIRNNPHNILPNNQTIVVQTNYEYDHNLNLLEVYERINDPQGVKKLIEKNYYNSLGRLIKKEFGKKADGSPVGEMNYEFNIRGWLKSINKDFVDGNLDDKYFGLDLAYDWGFNNNNYNGNVSGSKWRNKGDGEVRAYGYGYDNTNRLLFADFNQKFGNEWLKADPNFPSNSIDFSCKIGNGIDPNLAYDKNGNILHMQQMGLKITSSSLIDDLSYNYAFNGSTNTNKLLNVIDAYNEPDTKLGDFRTPIYYGNLPPVKDATTIDYCYDNNGNLVLDNNKNIFALGPYDQKVDGIVYNYLNLPIHIKIMPNKGDIEFLYDALGNKLRKIVHEHNQPDNITTYMHDGIYENESLKFFKHDQGRIRYVPSNNFINPPVPEKYQCDYFLKDNLDNVRVVITDELRQDKYPTATLEATTKLSTEKKYYDIQDANIVDKSTASGITDYVNDNGIGNNPNDPGFEATLSTKLYKLNSNGAKTGLGITLKVMAGDKIDVFGKSYYFQNTSGTSGNSNVPILDLLTAFLSAPSAVATTSVHGLVTAGAINTSSNISGINTMLSQQNTESSNAPTKPKAFFNVIFFDEQFKSYEYHLSMVGNNSEVKDHFDDLQNIAVNKNGFVYIYCSNESPVNVYIDNLQILHTKGALLEVTNYYPFGLRQEGICSKAAGSLINKYQYSGKEQQTKELSDGSGLDWYDYGARMYDNQVGRWIIIDPKADQMSRYSPYNYAFDNPLRYTDPDGRKPLDNYFIDKEGNLLGIQRTTDKFDNFYEVQNVKDGNNKVVAFVENRIKPGDENGRFEIWGRIPDIDKVSIVHQNIDLRKSAQQNPLGILDANEAQILAQQPPGTSYLATYRGADGQNHSITKTDPINPVDPRVTPDYIIPSGSALPTPSSGKAILPNGAFAPNLPATRSNIQQVTNSNGDVINVDQFKRKI